MYTSENQLDNLLHTGLKFRHYDNSVDASLDQKSKQTKTTLYHHPVQY